MVAGRFYLDRKSAPLIENPKTISEQIEAKPQNFDPAVSNPEPTRDGMDAEDRAEALSRLPSSLRGLPRPQLPKVGEAGELLPDIALRQLFDFYLSARGEENMTMIIERVELHLSELPEPARTQAAKVFTQYLEMQQYGRDQRRLNPDKTVPGAIALKRRLMDERRRFFDPGMAEAFFADEDMEERFNLDLIEIANDPSLSKEEKQTRIDALLDNLPEPLRNERQKAQSFETFRADRKNTNTVEVFGPEAAKRLSDLEIRRAEWDARVKTYRAELETALEFIEDRKSDQAKAVIADIRNHHFSGPELKRIEAPDKIAE